MFDHSYLCYANHRLQQDVSLLDLQPTVEDVFHAETANVDEYLQQIQDMTIIAAIQVRGKGGGAPGRLDFGLRIKGLARRQGGYHDLAGFASQDINLIAAIQVQGY